MTRSGKRVAAGVTLVVVLAAAAFVLRSGAAGPIGNIISEPDPTCPLTSFEPRRAERAERPAVAIKIENHPQGRPIAGLENAELVYEEPVEGGQTRFMAIYHCNDAEKAGPIRSARMIDSVLLSPYTRILGYAGANSIVDAHLRDEGIVRVREEDAGSAMARVPRPGIPVEHTLFANTALVRRLGRDRFDEPPRDDIFEFGDLDLEAENRPRRAAAVSITFGAGNTVRFDWDGDRWLRSDNGVALTAESGEQLGADNILIEEHTFDFSRTISDVTGAASPEIVDVTGSGRAVLLRDGRIVRGRWERASEEDPVRFVTREGDPMVLKPGTTWIELAPTRRGGDLEGGFDVER